MKICCNNEFFHTVKEETTVKRIAKIALSLLLCSTALLCACDGTDTPADTTGTGTDTETETEQTTEQTTEQPTTEAVTEITTEEETISIVDYDYLSLFHQVCEVPQYLHCMPD